MGAASRRNRIGPIATPRLILTPLAVTDAEAMVDVLADPSVYEFTGGGPPSRDDLVRRFTAQTAGSGRDDEEWFNWIVRRHATPIGYVQATVEPNGASLAWLIRPDRQGSGYATEAAAGMHAWLIDRGVTRFIAWIHPNHIASQRVAASLGLSETSEIDNDGEVRWSSDADGAAGDAEAPAERWVGERLQ